MGGKTQGRTSRAWRRLTAELRKHSRVCWLCGHDIDVTLPAKHPLSFTADHVRPRSCGGSPTLDNVRPAHRRCNSQKGNKAGYKPPLRTSRAW